MCRKIKLDTYLKRLTKINSNCIKDLNLRPDILKLQEESIWKMLFDFCLGNDFLHMKPKAKATKVKINKCDYSKLKSFYTEK